MITSSLEANPLQFIQMQKEKQTFKSIITLYKVGKPDCNAFINSTAQLTFFINLEFKLYLEQHQDSVLLAKRNFP